MDTVLFYGPNVLLNLYNKLKISFLADPMNESTPTKEN